MLAATPRDPDRSAPSDEQLMLSAGRGDRDSFASLVDRHHRRILNLLVYLVGDRELARDLTQECFLRLLRAAPRYEPRAKFSTYVATIARRLAFDARAKAWERREPLDAEPASPDPGPDSLAGAGEGGHDMNRDDDVRKLFEDARVEPTEAERAAILAAAAPILAEHAASAAIRRPPSGWERIRALFRARSSSGSAFPSRTERSRIAASGTTRTTVWSRRC